MQQSGLLRPCVLAVLLGKAAVSHQTALPAFAATPSIPGALVPGKSSSAGPRVCRNGSAARVGWLQGNSVGLLGLDCLRVLTSGHKCNGRRSW